MNLFHKVAIHLTRLRFAFYSNATYHKLRYFRGFGRLPNFDNPLSYSEAMLRLKLQHDYGNPQMLADKFLVRSFVSQRVGGEYLNTLYAVYRRVSQIRYADLPESFVLRCNHASGFNILMPKKTLPKYLLAKLKLSFWMLSDYSKRKREMQYLGIQRRILCERFLTDDSGSLRDYKLLCFSGQPKLIQVDSGRQGRHERAVFDTQWNLQNCTLSNVPRPKILPEKPTQLDLLVRLAQKLAAGLPFARIDFYLVNNKPLFGEITLHPNSGFSEFSPLEFSRMVASWIPSPVLTTPSN